MSDGDSGGRADADGDVDAALAELVDDARSHVRAGESAELAETLDALEAVARDELPDGDRRDRLIHGCERVAAHVDDDYAVATEYLRAMESLLAEE
ncbi:hypothetical protein [Candidatus Halobonum tyrrellensis]|uniref:DUF8101 domain-containing protein n=1 Tax=Candidatus Halobonum tyrrellensis G22 TaxID=1324957 RepID=V4GP25_9EURY|nr:hypothetical protein [Candidatus Halobonum tyrrellensis]ESP87146.1 hypothetical protein K933_15495 [Candidatus Halobonum tyrrellensis G22]